MGGCFVADDLSINGIIFLNFRFSNCIDALSLQSYTSLALCIVINTNAFSSVELALCFRAKISNFSLDHFLIDICSPVQGVVRFLRLPLGEYSESVPPMEKANNCSQGLVFH